MRSVALAALLQQQQGGIAQTAAQQQWLSAALVRLSCRRAQTHAAEPHEVSRAHSGSFCSTSGGGLVAVKVQQPHHCQQMQQARSYAKAASGKVTPAGKAAAASPQAGGAAADPLAPPEFRVKRVPQVYKGDAMARLTGPQRVLLEQLNSGSTPLRSLRQLGWPLDAKQVLALWHEQLSQAAGANVSVTPFVQDTMFQSAPALASVVREYVEGGKGLVQVEQALLATIANTAPELLPCEGIKVQLKGRMSGKGGKASKKVWEWGRTSTANVTDPVDYAHEAVVTRAGYIGIKVWIKYKRSHMAPQMLRSSRSGVSVAEVLAMPAPTALPSRSSSAWWNVPAPLQPQQHRTWQAFKAGYDALTGTWQQQQQMPSDAVDSLDAGSS